MGNVRLKQKGSSTSPRTFLMAGSRGIQFNRKNGESVEVEGVRVDILGDLIIVVGVR